MPCTRLAQKTALALLATMLLAAPAGAASMFYIRGGGDGHGIGMSQYGALGYAQHGKSYQFILAHYYRGTTLGIIDPSHLVRVLLGTGAAQFSGAGHADGNQLEPATTYNVRANADGTLTLLNSAGKRTGHFSSPLTVTGTGPLRVNGGRYRGAVEFRASGGSVQIVEAVDLEDYVRGVISAEVPASWPAEALQAQAVAARTYAITTNAGGSGFDVYPDTRSQMYHGVAGETAATDAAVAATRGQVVEYGGRPVVTYFFNSSGGHTENIENVWRGATPEPWLRGVPDPYDAAGGDPYHHWGYDMTVARAAAKLGSLVKGQLVGIQVTRHGSSPRILTASVVGTRGSTTVSGATLQHAFGLLTTYASFTTISTDAGLVVASVPGIQGTVFPVSRGASIAVEVNRRGGWQTVAHASVSASGAYAVQLPGSGSYRVAYRGVNGPSLSVK